MAASWLRKQCIFPSKSLRSIHPFRVFVDLGFVKGHGFGFLTYKQFHLVCVVRTIGAVGSTKGIDGYINGRAVQVKTKEGKLRKDSAIYASIRHGLENDIDDLVVIILNGDEVSHIDPVPLSEIPYSDHKQGRRYFLHKIKGYLESKEWSKFYTDRH